MTIGLIVNLEKPRAAELSREILAYLEEKGVEVRLLPSLAKLLGREELAREEGEIAAEADYFFVLGGDGTLLFAARRAAARGIPLLGINLGELGFLTEVEPGTLYAALEKFLKGEFFLEERMMLAGEVHRAGKLFKHFEALNDFVITRGPFSRLLKLETYVSGCYLATYPADGLIIASPTGSTAYSLSAGGPLIAPDVEAMVLTPICPHTFYTRPLVISSTREVEVTLRGVTAEVLLTVDGQERVRLEEGDRVVVHRARHKAALVRLQARDFFDILREKLARS